MMAQDPQLIWADEFSGTSLDLNKWTPQIGDGCAEGICGWGNNELQHYKAENATVSGGQLHITAKRERVQAKAYTSARIRTINKGDWTYGRFESLINLPDGGGLWPAFWMMPTDDVYGTWPKSGEIDIMEYVGWNPDRTLGYIHYGDDWPNNQSKGGIFAKHNGVFHGNWHEFAVEWEPGIIRWFVDDYLFQTITAEDVQPYHWPFDQNFHFILNVAVGGNLGGPVDDSALPATMSVEYVRVFDGFKPYITGDRVVLYQENGVEYSIGNVASNTNVSWIVPAGATIVSGQGTPNLIIDWDTAGGDVIAEVSLSSGTQTIKMDVYVEPLYLRDFHFVNFDDPANMSLKETDGTLTVVDNPKPSTLNPSAKSAKYDRNADKQWDCIFYNVLSSIPDASEYSSKGRKFYMDVMTSAPVGTEIIIQLETSDATATNYPTGRHSRYSAKVTKNGEWERLIFDFVDRPDGTASHTAISDMVILFATNSFTGHTYYWDNLDSYKADDGSGGTTEPEPEPDPEPEPEPEPEPGDAVSIYVESVVTGTTGGRFKSGTATVTVVDNLGSPFGGALVTGIFSGTFNETVSGTTGSDGKVSFQTSNSASGGVTVNFCVDDVSGSLPYDPTLNASVTCSKADAVILSVESLDQSEVSVSLYPNPVSDVLNVSLTGFSQSATLSVYNMAGRMVLMTSGTSTMDVTSLPNGVYMLEAADDSNRARRMFVK